ncbi:DNA polymerase III subunit gamma/tau [Rhodocyclus tenuis]|uniref:DNA polymerase III subunit gamma/tau n=1 Tax=Rhodocyclus gracilis TaxID=2929842 RepID=A0ABX0WIT9_9RHOO|nr:DNA polymerase III subunit gamma/tau [Rhodocyclus gracilis]NJA89639.1 DNA polymerase III subunit gamma/tau [Rhodocyclus gracilis]
MSYQVLARKWRPKSFSTLVGQEHVVRALTHALTENRLHHAYLFTGTRGVGKTTLARILAKSLNCEQGVSASPCGVCAACQEIDAGRFVDLLEVDAATNTRVEEMRQLLENAVYAPTRGRFKVYVIDEVHMLSTSAFNAMLKTLEEPPEHVKFILATTDPQKIPVTVLSRCLQFNLKQMTVPAIVAHLQSILAAEGISAEGAALSMLARSAGGSMRDALSLLDQAVAHGAGALQEAGVREMLGSVDLDHLFEILEALSGDDSTALLHVAEAMAERSLSFDLALQELAALLTRMQIAQLAPAAAADDAEAVRLQALAGRFDPEFVQLAYQIVIHGRRDLPLAPDAASGFVMTLLRLFAFRPATSADVAQAVPSTDRRRAEVALVRPAGLMAAAAIAPVAKASEHSQAVLASESSPRYAADHLPTESSSADSLHAPVETSTPHTPSALPQSVSISHDVSAGKAENADWASILGELKVGRFARELGQHCELRRVEEREIVLRLDAAQKHLLMGSAQEKLQQALVEHFGRPLRLNMEVGDVDATTPAETTRQQRRESHDRAQAAVDSDGFVSGAKDLFGATLLESTIKPV